MSLSNTTTSINQQDATVVIIEPDEITRDSLVFLLERIGLNVETCPSAECFLMKSANQNYACLITEVVLPGIDGLELIKKLAQLNKQIPTIILTQHNDVSMAVRAMRAGAMDFIEKPFVEPMLLDRLMQILTKDFPARDKH